jgi:hypothetical protein
MVLRISKLNFRNEFRNYISQSQSCATWESIHVAMHHHVHLQLFRHTPLLQLLLEMEQPDSALHAALIRLVMEPPKYHLAADDPSQVFTKAPTALLPESNLTESRAAYVEQRGVVSAFNDTLGVGTAAIECGCTITPIAPDRIATTVLFNGFPSTDDDASRKLVKYHKENLILQGVYQGERD